MRSGINHIIFYLIWSSILVSVILLFTCNPSFSQRHVFTQDNFAIRFPESKINVVFQEPGGLLWLGTTTGLFSYEGINYQLLPESEGKSISCLSAISEKEILAGTEDGTVLSIIFSTRKVEVMPIDSVKSRITGIAKKGDYILASTYGDGLWKYLDEAWQRLDEISDLSVTDIYTMAIDESGRILLGTDDGLCIIENFNQSCKYLSTKNGLPDNIVTEIETDKNGDIWLGFHQNGFCLLRDDLIVNHADFTNWSYGTVSSINTQLDDRIFIGTEKGVVLEYNLASEKHDIFMDSKENHVSVNDILVDSEANLWVADHQHGLQKTSLYLTFFDLPASIKSKNVQAIYMDPKDRLWFTSEDGLWEFSNIGHANEHFTKHLDSDIYGTTFISLFADGNSIWVGTFGVGIIHYQPDTREIETFKEKHGLSNNNVLSISATKQKIWFATLGGVSETSIESFVSGDEKNVVFRNYHEEDGLGTEYIYQVFVDSKENPWFATDGKGLTTLRDGKFINYSENDGLDSKVIYSITQDADENIWLATPKNGIIKFDRNTFKKELNFASYDQRQIASLYASQNSMIVIHKQGIDMIRNNQIRNFGAPELIDQINPDLNAITEDVNENVWIGHQYGIIKLSTNLQKNYQPDIFINKILVNLNPLDDTGSRDLSYNENYLTFNYTGIWYSDPLKIQYEYKLEGLDQNWIKSRDNFVTFSNLPAGGYSFSVRASVNENFEYAKVASYKFRILAPYWESIWFYLILSFLIFTVVGVMFVLRDRSLKKKAMIEQEKIQFQFETLKSQINPHFLFNSFNTLISIIEEEPKLATEYVEKLSDFFRNILMLREKDVISLKEEIELVMDYAFLQEKRFGENFSLTINIPDRLLDTLIPPLTIQLLAENAIKHNVVSRNKPLTLRIFIDQNFIIVQNEINLKSEPEISTNYGLENIIKRYQLLTDFRVEVLVDEKQFAVKLPIIQ